MAGEACETCGATLTAGGGGADPSIDQRLYTHLQDFNDPHRVRDWIPRTHFGIVAPVVDASYRVGDFYFDLTTGDGYSYRDLGEGEDPRYEWRQVVTPYRGSIDLSAYLAKAEAASTYVTLDYAAAHFLTAASLSGYVTSGALASALASYATQSYVSSALSSSGFITQAFADARYQRVAAQGEQFVTASALATALAAYKPTAELANFLGIANFVTYSYANGENGYIPKSQAESLNYAKQSWVSGQLENYVPLTSVSTIQASIYSSVMSSVYRDYATKAELAAAAADAGARLMYTPEEETDVHVLRDHAYNYVELDSITPVCYVRIPLSAVSGLARDFSVVVGYPPEFAPIAQIEWSYTSHDEPYMPQQGRTLRYLGDNTWSFGRYVDGAWVSDATVTAAEDATSINFVDPFGDMVHATRQIPSELAVDVVLCPELDSEDTSVLGFYVEGSPGYTFYHETYLGGDRLVFSSLSASDLARARLEFRFEEMTPGKFTVACRPVFRSQSVSET